MQAKRIENATRFHGQSEGYPGLPILDTFADDLTHGRIPVMKTEWEPSPDEAKRIKKGATIVVTVVGITPQPMRVDVGLIPDDPVDFLYVDYTNWKGKRAWRKVIPLRIEHGIFPHHGDKPITVMHVLMEDRGGAYRTLAMRDIHQMRDEAPDETA